MDSEKGARHSTGSQLPRRFKIGDWQVDQLQGIIQRGEEIARLRPLAMRFLVHLAARAPEPISTNDLVKEIWAPRIVGDDSVYVAVRELRKKLGDNARHPRYIETIPKRGVRLVAAVLLEAPRDRQTPTPVVSPDLSATSRSPPFVGREQVLASLESCLDSALRGRGRVVFLAGEPGIGKTRTTQEFADRAEARGVLVHSGWCDGSLVSPPGWPWVRLLRAILHGAPPGFLQAQVGREARAMLSTLLPELRTSEPDLPEAPDVSPERMTFELAQAVAMLLTSLAEPHGLIVILDDLHHADGQSLAILGVLAREISRARVVLVGTYRDAEVGQAHPLAGNLSDLSRLSHYERFTLSGLSRDDVARLLSQSKDGAAHPLDAIMVATDGNSLFVTEIIRAGAGQPKSADKIGPAALLPRSLREVILGRLRHLSADCRSAVDIASVIGREFAPETVELVGAFDVETVDRTVDEALKTGVFAPAPDGIVRFAHALIRDAIYEELPRRRRIDLHRTIAQSLSASPDFQHESSSHPEAIAHHFQEAGLVSEAIDYWEQAANVALHRSAHGEQIRRLDRALELISTIKPSQLGDGGKATQREIDQREIQLRLALGNAHYLVGGASSSASAPEFARTLELCNRYTDAPELDRSRFNAVNGLWGYHFVRLDTDETRELVKLQSDLAERAGSEAYRLTASSSEAVMHFFEGHFSRALETLDAATQLYARALARRIAKGTAGPWRTPALLSPVYYAWCLALVGRADDAQELAARSLAEARQLGTHAHVQALNYVAAVFETIRDAHRAQQTSEEIIELAERHGYSSWLAVGHCVRGWARSCLGDVAAGFAETQQGYDAYRASGALAALTCRAAFLAETMCRSGRVADAAQLIDETLAAGSGRIEHFFDSELLRARGECDLAQNETKAAIIWFRKARDLAVSQGSPLFELRAICSLIRSGASDKRLVARLRELTRQLANGIGQQDLDDARALAAAKH